MSARIIFSSKKCYILFKRTFYLFISEAILYTNTCAPKVVRTQVERPSNWRNEFDNTSRNSLEIKLNLKKISLHVIVNLLKMHLFRIGIRLLVNICWITKFVQKIRHQLVFNFSCGTIVFSSCSAKGNLHRVSSTLSLSP